MAILNVFYRPLQECKKIVFKMSDKRFSLLISNHSFTI